MRIQVHLKIASVLLAVICAGFTSQTEAQNVTRATLDNGLRVVLVKNTLAPVVTVEMNFEVGGDESPDGFPGMAHAEEHMAFRGCTGMTADQTATIYAQLGGKNNADTQQNVTQYYATVPAPDLDLALQAQATCLQGIDDSETEWTQERGAIEQEISRDLSNPTYKFVSRLNEDMFAGTPYAHDPLGTKASFDTTTAAMLKDFYSKWYTPSNAVLVVVGDFDPDKILPRIKQLFGTVQSHAMPKRLAFELQPVKTESFTLDSNLPYALSFVAFRFPGTDSPDYAAAQILADVLASQRGDLYAMVPAGKALAAEFGLAETYPKASVGYGVVALPADTDPKNATGAMRSILAAYADKGLPENLVEAAKRSEVAQAEFQRNSIPGLASLWSTALAAEHRNSPDEDVDALRKVTVADVNRLAKRYLGDVGTISAVLTPVPTGQPVAAKGFGGGETVTSAPTKPVTLPKWAAGELAMLKLPAAPIAPADTVLSNGIRLIVRTDRTSPTVTVVGSVKHDADLETPAGKEGVDDLLNGLYSYGSTTLDRIAFQTAVDDIAANESAGNSFSLTVLKHNFSRGLQLLADNELHPALPREAFEVVKQQTAQFVADNLRSPGYRTSRALEVALLPAGDPALREATPASIATLTLDDVKRYHAGTIRPDLTTMVIIGDITPDDARAEVEKWFGGWKAGGPKPETNLPSVPANKAAAQDIADAEQLQDSVTLSEELALNRFDPDYYPLQLGTHVLGGGFYATRLYHDLRQVAGYVYTVDVGLSASKTRATYSVTYGCNPENVSKARALVERDLKQMAAEPVSAAELHQAKALLLRQLPLGESSEELVAAGLLARAQIGLPLDEPAKAAAKYAALSAEDVRKAFAAKIGTTNLVQIVRGPAYQ